MSAPGTSITRTDVRLPFVGGLGLGAISLIIANAGLLSLYFGYDVTLYQLVLVYWCECVWIGIFSAIKLIVASIIGDPYENRWADVSAGAALFASLLVIVFTSTAFFALLGMMLTAILSVADVLAISNPNDAMYNHVGLVIGASFLLMAGHAVSLIVNFIVLGEYKTATARTLVSLPFHRSLALLVAILVSIAFVTYIPGFANTSAFAVPIILLKLFWDIRLHQKERRAFAESDAERSST